MERLDKLLANSGYFTRKEARKKIRIGKVSVDDAVVRDPGEKVDPESRISVDGELLDRVGKIYLMMHKPKEVVSSTEDPKEKTVMDLLPAPLQRVGLFPVGRLDKDVEGLLILCNDGDFAHQILSPRYHVDKTYFIKVQGALDEEDVRVLKKGLVLRDGSCCKPADLERLSAQDEGFLTIREGKYHQVKRMMAARRKPVLSLKRVAMGNLKLDETLAPGEWRYLSEGEKKALSFGNSERELRRFEQKI